MFLRHTKVIFKTPVSARSLKLNSDKPIQYLDGVMVPTLRTIKNSSYYYEYQENIHLGVKSTPAVLDCV